MAKITTTRFPQATPTYQPRVLDILTRLLEQIVQQLNFGFQQDLKNESTARTWFLG